MTIGSTTVATSGSVGNGATTVFNFTFSVEAYGAVTQASQIQVIQETIATGAETVLTLTTHYTTSFNADQNANPGGSITMVSAPSSAYRIWIRLAPSFLQATDYQNQGGFLMETVEDQADQQARQINVLADRIRRAPRVGIQAGSSFDGEITGDVTPGYIPQINTGGTGFDLVANNGASTLVTATGGTTARTLADRTSEIMSVLDFVSDTSLHAAIIAGTSSANATTYVQAAIDWAYAAPTRRALRVFGDFVCTSDIAHIHDVQLWGPGSIKVGTGRKWWAEPNEKNTTFSVPMTLYVDAVNGSDSNSGLSPGSGFALLTLQKAADILDVYGLLWGYWRIILAAGTYTSGATFFGMQNTRENPLYISGPTPASAWSKASPPANRSATGGSIPTAIFDSTGNGSGWAISSEQQSHLVVEHVKFTDWGTLATGNDEGALLAKDWSSIVCTNCHVWDGATGAMARENSDIVISGGYWNGLKKYLHVIMARYNTGYGASSAGDNNAELVEGCTFGADIWEMGNGHVDFTHFKNCGTAIYLRRNAHCALRGPTFECTTGTAVGFKVENFGSHILDGNQVWTTSGGGTFVRYRHVQASPDAREEATSWRTVASSSTDQTTSGTSALDVLTYSVEAYSFVEPPQALRVRIVHTSTLTASTANIEIRMDGNAMTLTAPVNAAAGLVGVTEFRVYARTATTQFGEGHCRITNQVGSVHVFDDGQSALTEDMTATRTLTVRVTCANAGDSFTVNHVEIDRRG